MAKVIIKGLPKKQIGGTTGKTGDQQSSYSLNSGSSVNYSTNSKDGSQENIRSTYPQVDRKDATVEIEKGEYVVSPDLSSIYQAGGKKHYAGGTPIKAKDGSYIVSDFIKTNQPIMEALGFDYDPKSNKNQTWAELLKNKINPKEYNSFASLLKDKEQGKNVDPYEYNTAKNKLPNYQTIVSKVALGNELTKAIMGKPYNIPGVAQPAMQSLQQPQTSESNSDPLFEAKMGGLYKAQDGVNMPRQNNDPEPGTGVLQNVKPYHPNYGNLDGIMQGVDLSTKYPWYKPFTSSQTSQGQITPTGANSLYTGDVASQYNNIPYWEKMNGKPFTDMKDFQGFMFSKLKEQDPNTINSINNVWGNTNAGRLDDGYGGARTAFAASQRLPSSFEVNNSPPTVPPVIPPKTPPSVIKKQDDTKPPIDFNNTNSDQRIGYDARNIMGMLNSMQTPPRQHPWSASYEPITTNGVYGIYNTYPIQASERTQADLNNQISSPSLARANRSYQVNAINGLNQGMEQVQNMNLGIASQVNSQNAQTMNQYNASNAQRLTSDYDKNVLETDNYYTQKKLAANDSMLQYGLAQNNLINEKALFAQNPQYKLSNLNDYGSIAFNKGKSQFDPSTQQSDNFDNLVNNFTKHTGTKPSADQVMELLKIHNSRDYTKTTKKPGQQGSTTEIKDFTGS